MSRRLNLATTPFVNESLPGLLVGAACVIVVVATFYHGFLVARLLSPSTSARAKEVRALDAELAELRKEEPALRGLRVEAATLKEWGRVKEIVDRRALGWSDLFARLEDVLPRGVRLVSIAPSVGRDGIKLELTAVARAPEDGFEFARALQSRPEFVEAVPTGVAEIANGGGNEFKYTMRYLPERAVATVASPSPSPSPTDADEEEADAEAVPKSGAP